MQIFSHNVAPLSKWDGYDPYGNHFRIDDKSVNDWVADNPGKTKQDFYAEKNETVSKNITRVFDKSQGIFDDSIQRTSYSKYSREMRQVLGASEEWKKFADIKYGDGRLIGLDIETFGNTRFGGLHDVFGITEIGIVDKLYGSTGGGEYSLAIGIDDRQMGYLNNILEKYKASSWDKLTKQEQVDLGRASMYAKATTEEITDGPFKGMFSISNVGSKSTNVDTISKGILNLNEIHKNAKVENVLPKALNWLGEQMKDDNVVISLANGNFDLNSFINSLRNDKTLLSLGKDERLALIQTAKDIKAKELDIIYALRALAGTRKGVSVDTLTEQWFGQRLGAAVDKQMIARHIIGEHIHSGVSDVKDQIKILEDLVDEITYSFSSDSKYVEMKRMQEKFTERKASDLYFFHHGQLNKTKGLEFAGIVDSSGKRVGELNYSIANEFWVIDKENSKYLDVDGEQKYFLTFTNAAELASGKDAKDATTFTIVRDTKEEAYEFVENNAKEFDVDANKRIVTKNQIIAQQNFKYSDYGRRQFEKMLDSSSVATTSTMVNGVEQKEIVGGYKAFSDFMKLEEAVGNELNNIKNPNDRVDFLKDRISKDDNLKKLIDSNSYYELQAFVGMHNKLEAEMPLLKAIKSKLDVVNVSDVEKTALLKKAYNETKKYIDSNYKITSRNMAKDTDAYVMSDVYGVDVEIKNKKGEVTQFHRINVYDERTAQKGVMSVLNTAVSNEGVDRDKIIGVINDLYSRTLLTEAEYWEILEAAKSVTKDGLHSLSIDIGSSMNNRIENILDGNTKSSMRNYFAKHVDKSKNIRFFGDESRSSYTVKGFENFMNKTVHSDAINDIIHSTIKSRAVYSNINFDPNSTTYQTQLKGLLKSLGITNLDTQANGSTAQIISEIFTASTKSGYDKHYSLRYYDKMGIKSFVVTPDDNVNGSSFILMTRKEDAARLQQKLLSGELDFSSRDALIKSGIYDYAGFEELKKLNRYQLNDTELITATQGKDFEKILTPYLNVTKDDQGVMRAYLNDAEYDFYGQHRKVGEHALEHFKYGEYEAGSKLFVKSVNNYLEDLSASASYRGVVMLDGSVRRIATWNPNDFIQARELRAVNALKQIFEHGVLNTPVDPTNLTVAQQIVHTFGMTMRMRYDNEKDLGEFYSRVLESSEFNEFFRKRLYVGTIIEDYKFDPSTVSSDDVKITSDFNQNFYQVIKQSVEEDTRNLYDDSVRQIFNNKLEDSYKQLLNEKKTEKGVLSTVDSADYNSWAILHNPMRPTFGQQNNGMYFRISDMDESMFEGLFDVNGDNFQKSIFFGTVDMTELELADKMELSKSGYNPSGIQGYDILDYDRNFMAQVKQTTNYDLQTKYNELRKLGKGTGYDELTDTQYTKAIDYFEKQLMSLHEDKILIASGLNEQSLFKQRDPKKMEMDWKDIDEVLTAQKLDDLVGKEINSKTVIGVRTDGSAVFYNGPATVLTRNNVDELLTGEELIDGTISNRRMTRILPTIGDIVDNKMMFNGAEKATVHSVDIESFAKYIGLSTTDKDLKTALRISNQLFRELSGGAIAIANMGGQKHANMMQTHSLWNAMSTLYQAEKYGEAFVDYANYLVGSEDVFEGFGAFRWDRGKIITNTRGAKNASGAIEYLYNQLSSHEMIDFISTKTGKSFDDIRDFNDKVINYIEDMKENNIILAVAQRQTMNEHMGTRVIMDDRIKQAILTRGIRPGGSGVQDVDVKWYEALDEFASNYDGTGKYNTQKPLQKFLDEYGKSKNRHRLSMTGEQTSFQKSVIGIRETLSYINNPDGLDIDNKNIVKIKLNELIDQESRMKGGLSSHELQNSIFFVDGKPSDFLASKALEVDLDDSFSIFIDLEDEVLTDGNKTYKGMLIPIQSVFSDTNDKAFFKNTQGKVVQLINKAIDTYTKPSTIPVGSTANEVLSDYYLKRFGKELEIQFSVLDKEADAYKAFNQKVAPISHQVLAQDEVSPLVEAMFDDTKYKVGNSEYTFQELLDERSKLGNLLLDDSLNPADIARYGKQYDEISEVLTKTVDNIANEIKNNPEFYTELVAGEANKKFIEAGAFFENVSGKRVKHYGLTMAMGIDAFENMGYDLGVIGLDVVNDYLTKSYEFENIHSFAANNMLHQRVKEIAKEFEQSTGHKIQDPNNIVKEISAYIQNEYGVSTRELNNAIAENKSIFDVLNPFRKIGIAYMEQVGTYADLLRYPMFRSQPAVRLLIDHTLEGNQLRSSSPILTLLSHVDHDGDTEFIMSIANGMGIMKSTDKRFKAIEEIYHRFGKEEYRELLAKSVSSMSGINTEFITNIKLERAEALAKFQDVAYKEAIENWKNANGITDSKLTPSQKLMAHTSKEMEQTFAKLGFNSVEDHESLIAAMAARIRKINIGKISTPNYALRNALLYKHNNKDLTNAQKQLINDTYFTLSNMFSEGGGLLSMGEQKVIDPKHGRDGMTIARTTKYTTGMSRIFSATKDEHIRMGLSEMIEAIGPGIFGTDDINDINKLLDIVLNNEMSAFNTSEKILLAMGKADLAVSKKISSTGFVALDDIDKLNALKGLRGLYDIKTQIPNFNFKSGLDKGSIEKEIYELIESIGNATGKNNIDYMFANTAYANLMKGIYGKHSGDKINFKLSHTYFFSGGLGKNLNDQGYVFTGIKNGKYTFQYVDLKTGELNPKIISLNKKPVGLFDANIKPIPYREFKGKAKDDIFEQLNKNRIAKSLNTLVLDKDGNVRKNLPLNFIGNKYINKYNEQYEITWENTRKIFSGNLDYTIPSDNERIKDRYALISKYAKAYDRAVTKQRISGVDILKAGVPDNSGDLIRQINQNIADNLDKYGDVDLDGYFIPKGDSSDFRNIIKNAFEESFIDSNVFSELAEEVKNLPSYHDEKAYNEALDFLKNNSYDIIRATQGYDNVMNSLDLTIQGFKDSGVKDSKLAPLTNIRKTRSDFIDDLIAKNNAVIAEVQNKVYGAIGGTEKDIARHFNLYTSQDISTAMVGFGEYIGTSFKDLSQEDIKIIKRNAQAIIDKNAGDLEYKAAFATKRKLDNYKTSKTTSALFFAEDSGAVKKTLEKVKQLDNDVTNVINFVKNSINQSDAAKIRQIIDKANNMGSGRTGASNSGGLKKNTLTGSILDSIKSTDLPMKQIGIGAAGLMALGLVNKALHKNDKKSSPLSPQRNDIQGDTPGTDNGYGYAPPSKEQVIYANESSGMQYKVSAKSKNYISDMQNARLINMSGGGTSQIHSSVDNSGVSNNWLANRFAEQLE